MFDFIGTIEPPAPIVQYGDGGPASGLVPFMSNVIRLIIVVGGIYSLLNFILAGYGFMSAGDDPKKIQVAWAKIYQSLIGLIIIAGSFLLAALFGWIIFGEPGFILSPTIYGPGD